MSSIVQINTKLPIICLIEILYINNTVSLYFIFVIECICVNEGGHAIVKCFSFFCLTKYLPAKQQLRPIGPKSVQCNYIMGGGGGVRI